MPIHSAHPSFLQVHLSLPWLGKSFIHHMPQSWLWGPFPAKWEIWVWSLSGVRGTQPPHMVLMKLNTLLKCWQKGCSYLFLGEGLHPAPCPSWTPAISHISRHVSAVSAGLAQGISCPATTKGILAVILQHSIHVFTSLGLEATAVLLLYWSSRPQWEIHLSA